MRTLRGDGGALQISIASFEGFDPWRARVEYDRAILDRLDQGDVEERAADEPIGAPVDALCDETEGVPELRRFATGKRDTNALIRRFLGDDWKARRQAREALSELPADRAIGPLVELVRRAAAPLAAGRLSHRDRQRRGELLRIAAGLLAERRDDRATAPLLELLDGHPSRWVRAQLGLGACDVAGPPELLRSTAPLLDATPPADANLYYMAGAAAAVLVDPASSFDRLGVELRRDRPAIPFRLQLLRTGHLIRAVSNHGGDLDPRWWPAAAPYLIHPAVSSSARQLFATALGEDATRSPGPARDAAVALLGELVVEDSPPPWSLVVGALGGCRGDAEVTALILAALERNLASGAIDAERFALEKLGDTGAVGELQRLSGLARGAAATALRGLIDQLADTAAPAIEPPGDPLAATLATRLEQAGFGARRVAQLLDRSVRSVALRFARRGSAPGSCRTGGDPDLPADLEWPAIDGAPLPFIAQIDLAAIDSGGELPAAGMLWLFADDLQIIGDVAGRLEIAARALYAAAPGPLARRPAPAAADRGLRSRRLEPRAELQPPPAAHDEHSSLGLTLAELRRWDTLAFDSPYRLLGYADISHESIPAPGEELLFQAPGFERVLLFLTPAGSTAAARFDGVYCVVTE